MSDDTAVIANITEQSWLAERTYGSFRVPGRGPGEPYALAVVSARKGTMDLGDNRIFDFPIPARQIADDIARQCNSDGGEGSFFGVFVCEGSRPTEVELERAHEQLTEFYKRQVVLADQEWERTHSYQMITDVQRRAARWLGLGKEWAYEPLPMVDCPACGEKIRPGVAICKGCGAILDAAKAAEFGLLAPHVQEVQAAAPASPDPAVKQKPHR